MGTVTVKDLIAGLPYEEPRPNQRKAFKFIVEQDGNALLELGTGDGKTGVGLAACNAYANGAPAIYVTPTKTLVDQLEKLVPGQTSRAMGRSDFPCLYYEDRRVSGITAETSPCYMLKCGHRVNQETGEVEEAGAEPCPYFQAKFDALQHANTGGTVVTTTAFFLMNRTFVPQWRDMKPGIVVVDEVHRMADTARRLFEHHMTDMHLMRAEEIVKPLDKVQAGIIRRFRQKFQRIALTRPAVKPSLLKREEVEVLLKIISLFNANDLEKKVRAAIANGSIDPVADKGALKVLEDLIRGIPRTIRSFEYALEDEERGRKPLNFVVAFYFQEETEEDEAADGDEEKKPKKRKKALFHLSIRSYYVAPVIRRALGPRVVGYSATIGDAEILGHETGLRMPFKSFPPSFPVEHMRIFMPTDTPDLAAKRSGNKDPQKARRMIAEAAVQFRTAGHRSLVVVVSDHDRERMTARIKQEGLMPVSYGNGVPAREAAARFKDGEGDVLIGTAAHYAEGVDLPGGIAPVIFFLRPGYPPKDDPQTQFEVQRFGGQAWKLWRWRVMMQMLQVRGRNIRTTDDLGVCFLISQHFRKFAYGCLPEWLRPAYRGQGTMAESIREAMELLK